MATIPIDPGFKSKGINIAPLLVAVALVAWFVGVLSLSQATAGVGGIGAGCLFAILARMEQSRGQHRELLNSMRESSVP